MTSKSSISIIKLMLSTTLPSCVELYHDLNTALSCMTILTTCYLSYLSTPHYSSYVITSMHISIAIASIRSKLTSIPTRCVTMLFCTLLSLRIESVVSLLRCYNDTTIPAITPYHVHVQRCSQEHFDGIDTVVDTQYKNYCMYIPPMKHSDMQ